MQKTNIKNKCCNFTKTPSENEPTHKNPQKSTSNLSIISFSLLDKIYDLNKLRQLAIYKCGSP